MVTRRQVMWQNIGFILIGLGILALIGWSVKVFFMAGEIPLLIRIAVGAIGVGILVLIGVAIRDRLAKAKTEDFKEVEK
jgi:hydrogenase-4 membrane subunit HyfE